jgi:hypothetical protein
VRCGRNDIIGKDVATHQACKGVLDIADGRFGHEIDVFGGSSCGGRVTL